MSVILRIPALRGAFSADNLPALRGFAAAGYEVVAQGPEAFVMQLTREAWLQGAGRL